MIGPREPSAGVLNTRGVDETGLIVVDETGLSRHFVANLVNGAITCIPINNNE